MHNSRASAWDGLVLEGGEKTHAVLAAVGRGLGAEQFRAGGEEVIQADGAVVRGSRLDARRPTREERHAVAALPEFHFVAPVLSAGEVTSLGEFFDVRPLGGAAVVGCENNERVLALAVFFKSGEDLSDRVIVLHHEIGVVIQPAFALPFLTRNDGFMGRTVSEVEEKRRVLLLRTLVEIGDGFPRQAREHVDGGVVLDHRVALDHALHVSGMVETVEGVEATGQRAVGDFRADRGGALGKIFSGSRVGVEEVEMPLAEDGRVVAMGFQKSRHRGAIRGDQVRCEALDHPFLMGGAPRVAPGQEAVACRRANRRCGVGIGKDHARLGERIEVRRRNFPALRIEALHIPVTKVIAEKDDDVRRLLSPTLIHWVSGEGAGKSENEGGDGDTEPMQKESRIGIFDM